ncbi:calcyclin-binding protein-like isoform X2 [Anneissia japonica]|uniref:calcyclin-binding protein-like isoform X2 n=1 Tax=Anneissia japonica TaxID=1529436 RepID=UPI00142565D6|nr:calcyclin-binding protein-like isoform X2 [Anneissia japonica]
MSVKQNLVQDVEEVQHLLSLATRERVKNLLTTEQRRLETEISKLKDVETENSTGINVATKAPTPKQFTANRITNYGWDQSDKSVKVYVSLKGVHTVPAENVTVKHTNSSFNLIVQNLEGTNHQLLIGNLLHEIDGENSSHKVKTDNLVLFLRKAEKKTWKYLTVAEQKSKVEKDLKSAPPKMDEDKDPSAGIMDMMRKMYEEGDDEMKRTIAKAWTESRDKKDIL